MIGSIPTTLIGFVNFGPLKTLSAGLTLLPRLVAWAWRERDRPRVIMPYNLNSPPGFVSVLAGWLTGALVVPVVADLQVPGHGLLPDTPLRRLDFWLQRRAMPLCDGLVVLTRRMADDFAPRVPFMQMEGALPDSLLPDPAHTNRCEMDGGHTNERVLMYAGGLSELKGIPLLLDAFSLIADEGYRLWITGNGPLRGLVQDAAARDTRITYWGFPPEAELRSLYQKADILVNPHSVRHTSARYLFPSKLIEYLGTGRPVVSTCSTPEVAAEYGDVLFAVPDDTPQALARTIQLATSLPTAALEELGERARLYVCRSKTWSVQAGRIAEFVRDRLIPV